MDFKHAYHLYEKLIYLYQNINRTICILSCIKQTKDEQNEQKNSKILLSIATFGFISISSGINAVSLSVLNHSLHHVTVTTELGSADLRADVGTVMSGYLSSSNNFTAQVNSNTPGVNPGSCTIDARKLTKNTGNVLTITKSTKRALIGKQTLKCKHTAHSKSGTKVIDKIGNALLDYGRSK